MSIVDVKLAAECEMVHRQVMEYWREGSPVKIWIETECYVLNMKVVVGGIIAEQKAEKLSGGKEWIDVGDIICGRY